MIHWLCHISWGGWLIVAAVFGGGWSVFRIAEMLMTYYGSADQTDGPPDDGKEWDLTRFKKLNVVERKRRFWQ